MTIRSKQKLVTPNPFNIVLIEPEIPPNTGNIARLCAATNTKLHLIHPLGFKITDSKLKRAGLDYWHLVEIKEYENYDSFLSSTKVESRDSTFGGMKPPACWFFSTRGEKNIWDVKFNSGDYLIFGSETKGIDEKILKDNKENIISIPMNGKVRSINLSTSVGIALYEGIRQVTMEKKEFEINKV